MPKPLRGFHAFLRDRDGNVAMLCAFFVVPLLISLGCGLNYVSAAQRKAQLAAIADAASLATVTPNMMTQSPDQAKSTAVTMFMAQAKLIPGLTFNPSNLVVTVTDTPGATSTVRTTVVTFSGTSQNPFPNFVGSGTLAVGTTSSASSFISPNTDFYVMVDTSPSMAIAATTDGINTMVAHTASQGGCAFACHQSNPAADNLGNPGGIDNYQLARNLNVTLRIDLVQQATSNLMDTIQSTSSITNAQYRVALYDFDTSFRNVALLTSNTTLAKSEASGIAVLETYKNGWLTALISDNDMDTNFDNAMNSINAAMPSGGSGTNNPGDTPQEVLFLVTDGVIDENQSGNRVMAAMGGNWCTTIKARGIRIAVLYTTYNPLPTNSFYNNNIRPFQPSIATNLQACASDNLYYQVSTNGDISAALSALFQKAVGSAHLTQ